MATIDKTIEVEVPVHTAYSQWSEFEAYPRFMEGIQEVHRLPDSRLLWVTEAGGEHKEWYARVTKQEPDRVIAWQEEAGSESAAVIFRPTTANKTEIWFHMDLQSQGLKEQMEDALGFTARRVEADLKRFKEFIEERPTETAPWRPAGDTSVPSGTPHHPRRPDHSTLPDYELRPRYGASGQGGSGFGGTSDGGTWRGGPGRPV